MISGCDAYSWLIRICCLFVCSKFNRQIPKSPNWPIQIGVDLRHQQMTVCSDDSCCCSRIIQNEVRATDARRTVNKQPADAIELNH